MSYKGHRVNQKTDPKATGCIVLDIETEPFCDEFRTTQNQRVRFKLAPKPTVACVYFVDTQKYQFYGISDFKKLLIVLQKAKQVVTYNGERFDFLVLRKFLKISRRELTPARSIDIFTHAFRRAGFMVSLDKLAKLNLGEGKKIKGKRLLTASLKELMDGCKSDVRQTYRLYKLHLKGDLDVPSKHERYDRYDEFDYMLIGSYMPEYCSECGPSAKLIFVEAATEDMTEGQMAEYLAGTWGYSYCPKCKTQTDWEM